MNIVIGRGRSRQVIELPGGGAVALQAARDPETYMAGLRVIFDLVGIPQPRQGITF